MPCSGQIDSSLGFPRGAFRTPQSNIGDVVHNLAERVLIDKLLRGDTVTTPAMYALYQEDFNTIVWIGSADTAWENIPSYILLSL